MLVAVDKPVCGSSPSLFYVETRLKCGDMRPSQRDSWLSTFRSLTNRCVLSAMSELVRDKVTVAPW